MPKEIFNVRNRITLQAAIIDSSEAAVHNHPCRPQRPRHYTTTNKLKITITSHPKF